MVHQDRPIQNSRQPRHPLIKVKGCVYDPQGFLCLKKMNFACDSKALIVVHLGLLEL